MRKNIFILIVVFVVFCAVSLVNVFAQNIVVLDVQGDVKFVSPGDKDGNILVKDDILSEGDRIITGKGSHAVISADANKDSIIKVKESSEVVLKLVSKDQIQLIDGKLLVFLEKNKRTKDFTVRTPCAVCGARGTGWEVASTDSLTEIIVFNGKVFVRGIDPDLSVKNKDYDIGTGYSRKIEKFKDPQRREKVSDDKILELEKEITEIFNVVMLDDENNTKLKNIFLNSKNMDKMHNNLERSNYRVDRNLNRLGDMKPLPVNLPTGRGRDDRKK